MKKVYIEAYEFKDGAHAEIVLANNYLLRLEMSEGYSSLILENYYTGFKNTLVKDAPKLVDCNKIANELFDVEFVR